MRYLNLATVALLGMTTISALAQAPGLDPATGARPGHEPGVGTSLPLSNNSSNNVPADTHSSIAPTLPASQAGADATAREYLTAARAALLAGRTGQAQQSLEMAETRALARSIVPDQVGVPSDNRFIAQIGEARRALGHGDSRQAIALIDSALAN